VCDRVFSQSESLSFFYIGVHTGEKSYKCSVHGTSFSESGNLQQCRHDMHTSELKWDENEIV